MSDDQVIYRNTLDDMRDGVMVIDLEGTVRTFNRAAETILGLSSDEIVGQRFGEVFFALEGSDDFVQAALDAIYESAVKHQHVVEFGVEPDCRTLAMTTSFLFGDSGEGARTERIGVIAVFSDVTELEELRDALKAMEEIRRLNGELQRRNEFDALGGRTFVKAVDEQQNFPSSLVRRGEQGCRCCSSRAGDRLFQKRRQIATECAGVHYHGRMPSLGCGSSQCHQ